MAIYFYRVKNDEMITEFCVAGATDPNQQVETPTPDGTMQRWKKRVEGDLLVFTPPDGYTGGAIGWKYDRTLQQGRPAVREELERELLKSQVSVSF